jgi:hypothetical protein
MGARRAKRLTGRSSLLSVQDGRSPFAGKLGAISEGPAGHARREKVASSPTLAVLSPSNRLIEPS